MQKKKSVLTAVAAMFLLSACAAKTPYHPAYGHGGPNQPAYQSDALFCNNAALGKFPPAEFKFVPPQYTYLIVRYNAWENEEGLLPLVYSLYERDRDDYFKKCMGDRGWEWIEKK